MNDQTQPFPLRDTPQARIVREQKLRLITAINDEVLLPHFNTLRMDSFTERSTSYGHFGSPASPWEETEVENIELLRRTV
jgi:hypothetical protein